MSEFDDPTNITRLPVPRSLVQPSTNDDEAALRHQVSELLADADPVPMTVDPEPQWLPARKHEVVDPIPTRNVEFGPEPGHRNAIKCPQCDRWAWQVTEECWHCRYNLFKHAERAAAKRRKEFLEYRRKELSQWARGLAFGGVAMIYFSQNVTDPLGATMMMLGLGALFGAFVCGKALVKLMDSS